MKYKIAGDSVNSAARLESYRKLANRTWEEDGCCRILLAESTA
jgi:class 3 adenylate cyclase